MRQPLPPLRICSGCGLEYRSYQQLGCYNCRKDGADNRSTLAQDAAEQRAERRGPDVAEPENKPKPVPYGEFPPGF